MTMNKEVVMDEKDTKSTKKSESEKKKSSGKTKGWESYSGTEGSAESAITDKWGKDSTH
jgi:hypothetical protein